MSELVAELNRLAGTTGLEAGGAANKYAGTVGREVVAALNAKAGTTGLDLAAVLNRLAGTTGLGVAAAAARIVKDSLVARWKVEDFATASSTDKYLWDQTGNGHDLRLGAAGTATVLPKYVRLPGTSGNYVSTPDKAQLDLTTELDVRVRVALDNWTAGTQQVLVAKQGVSGNMSFHFRVNAANNMNAAVCADGTTLVQSSSGWGSAPARVNGEALWLRVTWRASDGRTQYFTAPDSPTMPTEWIWTGVDGTMAVSSLFNSTAPLEIGARNNGMSDSTAGRFFYAEVRSSIDGTVVAKADFSGLAAYTKSWSDGLGNTWTVNQSLGSTTNDPVFLKYEGDKYAYLPAVAGNYVSTPDDATLDITGDVDLRADVALDSLTSASGQWLVAKWNGNATEQRSYLLNVSGGGFLQLQWTTLGTSATQVTATSSVALSTVMSAGERRWLRAWVDVNGNTGGLGWRVRFFTSTDGVVWTQLGTDVTGGATATSIFSSNAPLEIGSINVGVTAPTAGKVYAAQVRNGIDGPIVANFIANMASQPYASYMDNAGKTWTFNRSSSGRKLTVVDRHVFLFGTDDYMSTPHHSRLSFTNMDAFTMAVAVRSWLATASEVWLSKGAGGSVAGVRLYNDATGAPRFTAYMGDATTPVYHSRGTGSLQEGVPGVFAMRHNPSESLKLYAFDYGNKSNGTGGLGIGNPENTAPVTVGMNSASQAYASFEFIGGAIYRSALTDEEIALLNAEYGV